MTTVAKQVEMWTAAERRSAEVEKMFMALVADGLTKAELEANIARRPSLWSRFSSWLEVLD